MMDAKDKADVNDSKERKNGSNGSPTNNSKAAQTQVDEPEKLAHKRTGARSEKKKIDTLKQEVELWRDKFLRKSAEFENYRKRRDREIEQSWKAANADLIKRLLPILDDLERSLASAKENKNFETLVKGLELIHKSFLRVLQDEGVSPIESKGVEFNPELHEAMMQVEEEGVESNIVVDEHEKGYMLDDKLLRPAKVIVSK